MIRPFSTKLYANILRFRTTGFMNAVHFNHKPYRELNEIKLIYTSKSYKICLKSYMI